MAMKVSKKRTAIVVDIEDCPRCGKAHESQYLTAIEHNPTDEEAFFMFCAETAEPVMFSREAAGVGSTGSTGTG